MNRGNLGGGKTRWKTLSLKGLPSRPILTQLCELPTSVICRLLGPFLYKQNALKSLDLMNCG